MDNAVAVPLKLVTIGMRKFRKAPPTTGVYRKSEMREWRALRHGMVKQKANSDTGSLLRCSALLTTQDGRVQLRRRLLYDAFLGTQRFQQLHRLIRL